MKKLLCIVLLLCLTICTGGCSDKVETLLEEENYEQALALMEEDPEKYGDLYDQTRFHVAQTAFENKDFAYAATLLQNNAYAGASTLLDEVNYHIALPLMENGEYEAALAYLEENHFAGAASVLDEAKYQLACLAVEKEDYATAISYLEGNNFDDAQHLLNKAKYSFASFLLESEDYKQAIPLLENNKYMYAGTLLKEARNLGAAMEIEQYYQEILTQIDTDHPGTGYYTKLCDMLNEIYTTLERDGHVDNASEQFAEIFGYKPKSVAGAKEDMERLQAELLTKYFYDTPFIPYAVMDYLMEIWGRPCVYTHFEMTDTHSSMILDQPYEFIKKASISPKTMAYLLASFYDEGAQITRDGSTIIITFKKYQPNGDYSRGYLHCAPNSQEQEIEGFFMGMSFDHYDAYLDTDGLYVTVTFTPATRYYLKYLSIELMLVDINDNCVTGSSYFFENMSDTSITFTAFFQGVESKDLPGGQYMLCYYLAAVMNN